MARNDILDNEDGLWRRLKKLLKDIGDERTRTSTRVSESDLRRFTAQVAVLDADFAQYQKLRLFTDTAGKGLTITKLITSLRETGVLTLHSAEHATLSRRAVENRMATVLDPKTLERCHVETLGELVDLLERYSSHAGRFGQYDGTRHAEVLAQVRVEPNLPHAVPELRGFFTLNATVKGYPKLILDGLREVSRDVQFAVWTYRGGRYGRSGPFREYSVKAGQSDVADVWTDGQQYLAVHEDRLSGAGTARDVELIILDTLTTLLPGRNSMTEAPDDSTAEDLMHVLRATPRLTEWTFQVIRHVAQEGLRQGVKVPNRLLQVLGQAERLDDQAQREPALN
ncbi:hypothetical protein [Deinococcus soli (ex Cha et al. 2016)]|uniref:hypothetical protein n=1 Tax=Deinococcus soli (ex Cha et al. 2016) TaxID=1309411 RepID=UPI001665C5F2|nr:hypothetical protein [Deinococcus soli (ex Cha et al. 2016)]GGB70647.1 hypothetical protein GCM10008019_28510 [Deinococcus soli (ex Cha et al. 2016)]